MSEEKEESRNSQRECSCRARSRRCWALTSLLPLSMAGSQRASTESKGRILLSSNIFVVCIALNVRKITLSPMTGATSKFCPEDTVNLP